MNIRKFKEIVDTWDEHKEDLNLFRAWSENCYELFNKELELEIADHQLLDLNEADAEATKKKLRHCWEMLDIQIVINLYSKMGWKLDDSIRNKNISVAYNSSSVYYESKLSDAVEKLKLLDDDVEFCYGNLCLAKHIDASYTYMHQRFVKKIYSGLREF